MRIVFRAVLLEKGNKLIITCQQSWGRVRVEFQSERYMYSLYFVDLGTLGNVSLWDFP